MPIAKYATAFPTHYADPVTIIGEARYSFRRNAFFERQQTIARAIGEAKARSIQGVLRVEVIVQHRTEHLEMTLWLHEAAHHAETRPQLAILQRHTGDDGMVRALARSERIWMSQI